MGFVSGSGASLPIILPSLALGHSGGKKLFASRPARAVLPDRADARDNDLQQAAGIGGFQLWTVSRRSTMDVSEIICHDAAGQGLRGAWLASGARCARNREPVAGRRLAVDCRPARCSGGGIGLAASRLRACQTSSGAQMVDTGRSGAIGEPSLHLKAGRDRGSWRAVNVLGEYCGWRTGGTEDIGRCRRRRK